MGDRDGAVMTAPKFSAFISYSHADAAIVRKLHSRLEGYRLPKGLNARAGTVSGRLGKIFRDREDLSAATDLSDAITDALDRSEALVVVCSPEARASQWVGQEIEYFRNAHPDRPILAAIVRGEPADAFPDALTADGTEPLAADLRKEGDGLRLGFLKVVAGVAGVPLDALVQRDSQRQVRRVMAVTGIVALVAVAMGAMTLIAIQARDEARTQRGEAEGLVGYMINDLREDLRRVGSIDTMRGVSARALEYYSSQDDLSELSTQSLIQRAKALQGLGEDLSSHTEGDPKQIAELFAEAYRTTEALYVRSPDDNDIVYAHAQSAFWVGLGLYNEGRWPETERYWEEYLALAQRYESQDGKPVIARRELGYAQGNLCTLALHRTDRQTKPLATCRRAEKIMEEIAADNRDDAKLQATWANRLGWLADAQAREGEVAQAVETYERQNAILEKLYISDPDNAERADQLMRARMTLAEALGRAARGREAASVRQEALAMAREMVKKDENNGRWKTWLERIEQDVVSNIGE